MSELRNVCAGSFGAIYDYYIEREWLSALIARVVWGIDMRSMYASMSAIGRTPEGATILDAPCGGGVAFRALRDGQRVRYIGVDLAVEMLARARRRAEERGLAQIELIQADMCALPLADASVDLCLSYSGLHCVADPALAISELARCLRNGGVLIGTTFLKTGSRRQRTLLAAGQRRRETGPVGTRQDLHSWLATSGMTAIDIEHGTGFALFTARKTN
jgi:ubiquinone/menaquinone biosynthesis C-methylase UbiE